MTERSVKVRLSADVAEGVRNVRQFGAETKKSMGEAEKATASSSRALDDLGSTAGRVGLAAATGLGLATKAAMDWESDWAGVTKTVDGTAAQMAVLEDELRGLATTLPATHSEIAGVAEAAGQLGVAREDITDFTRTMVDLGETTNLTAEDAATSIAQMANVMGTAPDEIDNLGAALVALGNDGASTEAQIIGMAQRIAGAGAQIGLAESDILAIANAAASMGIEVEAGGTAVSRVFTDMAKATAQGGEKLDLFARTAGMSAREFAAAFESDPARAFAAFTQGLDRINKSGGDVFTTLDQLSLSDVRVSQALLGMAASGDLLTDSLALGKQAWEENIALAIEAAKRYDTTEAKTQIAWNNMKDAAIDFGDVALPIVADVADGISDLAQTVSGLPGPVKSASMSLLGIAAVFGGGLWFTAKTISGVKNMRDTLSDLAESSPKTAGALDKVGKAATAVGIAFAGFAIADSIAKIGDKAVPGLEATTRALIDLAASGNAAAISAQFNDIGDSIDRLSDKNWAQRLNDSLSGALGGMGAGRSFREATADIETLDTALANLVNTGNADMAAAALDNLVATGKLSADELADARPLLVSYNEALAGVENDALLAADGSDAFTDATKRLADQTGRTADDIAGMVDQMREARSEALRAANAELDYQAALDDARDSIAENGRTLNINTEAGRANRRSLYEVAGAWNNLSAEAKNAPGAYAAARRSFIDLAESMGASRKQARELAREIMEIPDRKAVQVSVDTAAAQAGLESFIASASGRVISIGTRVVNSSPNMIARAAGGPIPGQSPHKRADNIPIMATAGEYMHQVDAVDYYGLGVMDAINQRRIPRTALQGYAEGGPIGGAPGFAAGGSIDQRLEVLRLQQQINELRRDLNATGKDALKPLARAIAEAELEAAKRDLRQARRAPVAERRAELREQRAGLRSIELDVEAGMSVEDTRAALREFRRDVKEAGGTWTNAMARQAGRLIDLSKRYAATERSLEAEKARRDELDQTLQDQIRTLEDLQQTMDAFSSGVARNFLSDPFNQSYTASGDIGGAPANLDDPALVAARDQLGAAEARLAEIRGRDMDPLQRSYLASRAVAEVAQLRDQVDQLERSTTAVSQMADATERTVSGLQAFEEALQADIDRLTRMDVATEALIAKGLDPLSDFYAQLVQSGDVDTAEQLAALTPEQVDYYEELYGRRGQLVAQYAAEQTELLFGARLDEATRLAAATEKALGAVDRTIGRLENRLETVIPQRFEQAATKSIEALGPQLDRIVAAIAAVPREMTSTRRTGKGKGRA